MRRLRLLRELAREGTIAGTARVCSLTPSAVSQQLALLQREVGTPLYFRDGRRLVLTEAAVVLVEHTEQVLADLEEARASVAALTSTVRGLVRLAAFPTAARALAPDAIARCRADHPDLRIRLSELETTEAIDAVRAGHVDVALVYEYSLLPRLREPGVRIEPLLTEPLLLALPTPPADEPLPPTSPTPVEEGQLSPASPSRDEDRPPPRVEEGRLSPTSSTSVEDGRLSPGSPTPVEEGRLPLTSPSRDEDRPPPRVEEGRLPATSSTSVEDGRLSPGSPTPVEESRPPSGSPSRAEALRPPLVSPTPLGDGPLPVASLADQPWIAAHQDDALHAMLERACAAAGFAPRLDFVSSDYTVIFALVRAGLGVSIVPRLALESTYPDIELREIADAALSRTISAAIRAGSRRDPRIATVLDALHDVAAELPTTLD